MMMNDGDHLKWASRSDHLDPAWHLPRYICHHNEDHDDHDEHEHDDDDDDHDDGHDDGEENNDGYLAGEMVDLVCVLALRELPIEQRHIFVWLILQHLCICVFTYLCVCVFVYFFCNVLYFQVNNIAIHTSTPSPPPVSFFDASATE